MLGNLRDFLSVVQEGLSTNNNLRQTLEEVKKVRNIFKEKPRTQQYSESDSKINFWAGAALLDKYQTEWAELHDNADKNAKAAEEVDKLILEINERAEIQFRSANELAQNLAHIPNLTAAVAKCMDSLKNVQSLLKTVEEELVEFEDVVERSKMEKWKMDHQYHLTLYQEKKMASLEEIRSKLSKENMEQRLERERRQLAELQARRENSTVAFNSDMARYMDTGIVPRSVPSTPKMSLEQVQLDTDSTDLERFLDS